MKAVTQYLDFFHKWTSFNQLPSCNHEWLGQVSRKKYVKMHIILNTRLHHKSPSELYLELINES